MSSERKGVEFFVGLFLLLGFGMVAAMMLVFGRLSKGMEKFYPLVVEFPNAAGLVKGCDVLISGARVGFVTEAPRLVGSHFGVAVPLNIKGAVSIPRTASFQIRTNGMLGDAYIDVLPPDAYTEADLAKPGETIKGNRAGGLDELTAKGGVMIDTLNDEILRKLSANLDEIKAATTNLNARLLSEKNLKNVEETFSNLNEVTSGFAKTAKDLDIVVLRAQEVIDATKVTMKTTDSAAAELKLALTDIRKTADTATEAVGSAKLLINKAYNGEGALGTLITDKQLAQDLRSLIANMRRSGVLFYKDRPLPASNPEPAPPAQKAKPRR